MKGIERQPGFNLESQKETLERDSESTVRIIKSPFRPDSYTIFFDYDSTQVTASITLKDAGKKLVIHVLQADDQGAGFGSKVLKSILAIGEKRNMTVIADEVLPDSQGFWEKNGFTKCPDPNLNNDFEYMG
jgi:GNAT superfamily N-acetyltransferase